MQSDFEVDPDLAESLELGGLAEEEQDVEQELALAAESEFRDFHVIDE
jgi:hypothetical protein